MRQTLRLAGALCVLAGAGCAEDVVDPLVFQFPLDQLATQGSDPFKLAGRVMDEEQPRWNEFHDTLALFPDTSSCLISEERGKELQNVLAFDWKAMKSLTEIDICVWRIATTLDDIDLMRDWLAAQGFTGSYNTRYCESAVRTPYAKDTDEFCGIDSSMSIDDFNAKTAVYSSMPLLKRLFWRKISRRATLGVGYDFRLRPRDVSSGIVSQ